MKILYVTTIGGTMNFFQVLVEELVKNGHSVDIICNDSKSKVSDFFSKLGCNVYSVKMSRSPLNRGNLKAINQIKNIVANNKYDIVHCHTPVAAMCTRLACRKARNNGTKVIYTAHGFHFYKGAPLKNWLLYYPVEKICAHFTDVLITINKEDYTLAKKKMKAKRVEYVPGVGIDLNKFGQVTVDKTTKRKELGIPEDAKLILSVGELNENKNHETVIRAIKDLDVYYIIAGKGGLQEHLQNVINELDMTAKVKLLGFRRDVTELYHAADIYVLPSIREGLNVSIMEAMASGLPVLCGRIRGNTDLIDENGGELFDPLDVVGCNNSIKNILSVDACAYGEHNVEKVKHFSIETVNKQMTIIYEASIHGELK